MYRLAEGAASGQLDNYGLLRGMDMDAARRSAAAAQEMADKVFKSPRCFHSVEEFPCMIIILLATNHTKGGFHID